MLCKNCEKEIRDGSEFCKYCGQKVEKEAEFLFCASCGKQIKNNSLFCKHCGASVGNEVTPCQKKVKHKKTNLAIIIALIVIVGLAVFSRDEEKTGKQPDESTYNGGRVGKDESILVTPALEPGTAFDNNDCFVCGGDGKKDCTSCDGGYYIEYESGSYLGYGPTTREVRKKCRVCGGNGEVKCFH